eukprot:5724456-Prymnesium_polylepis.1
MARVDKADGKVGVVFEGAHHRASGERPPQPACVLASLTCTRRDESARAVPCSWNTPCNYQLPPGRTATEQSPRRPAPSCLSAELRIATGRIAASRGPSGCVLSQFQGHERAGPREAAS